ncbi:semaphorin-5B-like isoform X1 [Ruditapes philippinarum]|uniref:semaphorin-5B-like isoform X1 n=1 Tax=Ruditapes philippinarum TaxID=129788 RepID=UPI00295A9A75|nr:semaphorin-5B-like isoform X1 [Ruditapes philippinarum]
MKFGKSKADLPGSSDSALYENTNILPINTFAGTQITNIEEEDYETIDVTIKPKEVRDSHERKKKNASTDAIEPIEVPDSHERKKKCASNDTLKRLKCRFNVMIVLITFVNITLVSLVIVLFVTKSSVDSHWAQWSSWTSCDVTCGKGKHLRLRTCTNPLATTNDCIGESLQTGECTIGNCTADSQWSHWSSWTSCDVTCGQGIHRRSRTCTNLVQANDVIDCPGENFQVGECSKGSCPVDGQWAYWSRWTSCDVTCGKGRKLRTRRCTNPMPENKGKDCIGESLQSSQCSEVNCAVNGQWAYWSSWTSCDVTCGKGRRLRTRRCTNPMPENYGRDCFGESLQSSQCSEEKCQAIMSAFSVTKPDSFKTIDGNIKLNFSSTIYQYGNDFDISTGIYTCHIPGVYHFSVTLIKKRASSRVDLVSCTLYKNRQSLIVIKVDPTDDDTDKGNAAISQSIVINLDVRDIVYLSRCSNASTNMEAWSSFTGVLLYDNN